MKGGEGSRGHVQQSSSVKTHYVWEENCDSPTLCICPPFGTGEGYNTPIELNRLRPIVEKLRQKKKLPMHQHVCILCVQVYYDTSA